jgi:membrane associated rhomboid family serine protease
MLKQTTTPFLSVDKNPSLFAQVVVGASGVLFTLTGLALLLAPRLKNIALSSPSPRRVACCM